MPEQATQLKAFVDQFLGYGSLSAKTWFLGPEEAGVASAGELLERVRVWRELDAKPVVDLHGFHTRLGAERVHYLEAAAYAS